MLLWQQDNSIPDKVLLNKSFSADTFKKQSTCSSWLALVLFLYASTLRVSIFRKEAVEEKQRPLVSVQNDLSGSLWNLERARGPPVHILVLPVQSLFPSSSAALPRPTGRGASELRSASCRRQTNRGQSCWPCPSRDGSMSIDLVQARSDARHTGQHWRGTTTTTSHGMHVLLTDQLLCKLQHTTSTAGT
jgi:hypothetical protein